MSGLFEYDPGLLSALDSSEAQIQIVSLKELQPVVEKMMSSTADMLAVMDNQREAYEKLSAGEASILPIQTVGQPPFARLIAGKDAQVCVKTGYLREDDYYVSKVAGGGGAFAGNTGMLLLFSQKTLKLEKMLLDEGVLTEIRTAAASALASSAMMPAADVSDMAYFGCGIQTIWQLRFLTAVFKSRARPLPIVHLKTRSPASALKFIESMRSSACALDREWTIVPLEAANLKRCNLVHTCTTNRGEPLFSLADLAPNVHITAVGADSPGKRELALDIIEAAELCVTDSLVQTCERGEFQHYIQAKGLDMDERVLRAKFVEMGDFLSPKNRGKYCELRADGKEAITVFDTSGVAVQDVSIAKLAAQMLDIMRSKL